MDGGEHWEDAGDRQKLGGKMSIRPPSWHVRERAGLKCTLFAMNGQKSLLE